MQPTMGFVAAALLVDSNAASITILRDNRLPPANSTHVECSPGTRDPVCRALVRPSSDIITEITYPNGTIETKRNLYTREQLRAIRIANKVKSIRRSIGEGATDASADFIANLTRRESAPPICHSERQKWYDETAWGYWYQSWKQVGNCFYCDDCTEAIQVSFSATQSWTVGLGIDFDEVLKATFDFSWGQTQLLSDTRTCVWKNGMEHACHSLWYQPLMTWHNGDANYQTHMHYGAGQGLDPTDDYYDHNEHYANVNQAANPSSKGVNQGNLGCNSGCDGDDKRQCLNGNNGGTLWGSIN